MIPCPNLQVSSVAPLHGRPEVAPQEPSGILALHVDSRQGGNVDWS